METLQRKLIDLSPGVVRVISRKARSRSMSCKKYIEALVEQDALKDEDYSLIPEDVTDPVLLSLVGIARKPSAEAREQDERLDYIMSKL